MVTEGGLDLPADIRRARGCILYGSSGNRILDLNLNQGRLILGHRPAFLLQAWNLLSRTGEYVPGLAARLENRFLASTGERSRNLVWHYAMEEEDSVQPSQGILGLLEGKGLPNALGPAWWAGVPLIATVSDKPGSGRMVTESFRSRALAAGLFQLRYMRNRKTGKNVTWCGTESGILMIRRSSRPLSSVFIPGNLRDTLIKSDTHIHLCEEYGGLTRISVPLVLEDGQFRMVQSILEKLRLPARLCSPGEGFELQSCRESS